MFWGCVKGVLRGIYLRVFFMVMTEILGFFLSIHEADHFNFKLIDFGHAFFYGESPSGQVS